MAINIRTAATEDIITIQQLAEAIWWPAYSPILSADQISYMLGKMYSPDALAQQMRDGQQFLLLENDNSSAGFAAYSSAEPRIYKLNKLYVLPNLQTKGLGKALLDEVINRIKLLGAHTLILNVNRYNKAKTFYEKLGFKVISEEDINIGQGYYMNDYIMSLAI